MEKTIKRAWENLANAVIQRAVLDYIGALVTLKDDPDDYRAESVRTDCEKFFNSKYYSGLTKVSPEYIMELSKKEAERYDGSKRRFLTHTIGSIID